MGTNGWTFPSLFSANATPRSNSITPSSRYSQPRQDQSLSSRTQHSSTASVTASNGSGNPRSATHFAAGIRTYTSNGSQSTRGSRPTPVYPRRPPLSNYSTEAVEDSLWFAEDFMLGAGMVVIQPSSGKIVVLSEEYEDTPGKKIRHWFLPKGRKDVGETLEHAALREAYEESGYRVSFLPVLLSHNAPAPPGSLARSGLLPSMEPFYINTLHYGSHEATGRNRREGEYLTFWYIGQIPEDAVYEHGTGMANELHYKTSLLEQGEAVNKLGGVLGTIVKTAYSLWQRTVKMQATPRYQDDLARLLAQAQERVAAVASEERPDEEAEGRKDTP